MIRLKEQYEKEVMGRMMKEFSYKNVMEVPRLVKNRPETWEWAKPFRTPRFWTAPPKS